MLEWKWQVLKFETGHLLESDDVEKSENSYLRLVGSDVLDVLLHMVEDDRGDVGLQLEHPGLGSG